MKVAELIRELEKFDPKARVHFAYPYGDATGRIVAPVVDEVVEGEVIWCNYLDDNRMIDPNGEYEHDHGKGKDAVILKG